jgi:hypothetical protein
LIVAAKSKTPAPANAVASNKSMERKWAAEDALRTMTRAAEIKNDPRLMADVKRLALQKTKELAAIAKK